MAIDERRAAMGEAEADAESRARGAAAAHGPHMRHWKSGRDAYIRVRDIRAEVAAEDRERGRRTW